MPLSMIDLLIVLITVIGGAGVQIWLSTRKHFWLGLILPLLSLGYSIYMVPQVSFYSEMNSYFKVGMYIQQNMLTIALLVIFGICQWRLYKTGK
ncbi:hypothetical protein GCM10025886_12580 [Tetragenococcus halophilus subsp. flandriensis]|uniref:hypothetical protein n=1 Tax=Tetragenococcus halophilus TaxID=51669 RepID=UPI0023EA1F40|nr:hypothetical protein [Tetragenococcus halophilus]GMA08107.1 hypothetical protein GCM10025886_12580 [Tetragenococcus halophilus subsp. flandriensis]